MNKFKIFGISVIILLAINVASTGFISSIYAVKKTQKVEVNCKDVALALITWAQSIPHVDSEEIADNEDYLSDHNVKPPEYEEIVDGYLEDLLDDVKDGCDNLSDGIQKMIDRLVFRLP
ncbi:MAG: hypothetical protein DA328_01455 [Nitrososphaeraceae archaeon]|nr:hypothetical protein [Nitrososphaeraceae archaeon]